MNFIAAAYLAGGVSSAACAMEQPNWGARITLAVLSVLFVYAAASTARRHRHAASASCAGAGSERHAGGEEKAGACAMEDLHGRFHDGSAPAAPSIDGTAWMKEREADRKLQAGRRAVLDSLKAGGRLDVPKAAPEGLVLEADEAFLHAWGVRLHRAAPPAEGAEAARTAKGFAAASGIPGKEEERIGLRSMGNAVAALTTKRLYLLSLTAPRKIAFSDIVYLRPLENGILVGIANEGAIFMECAFSGTQERDFAISLVNAALSGSSAPESGA